MTDRGASDSVTMAGEWVGTHLEASTQENSTSRSNCGSGCSVTPLPHPRTCEYLNPTFTHVLLVRLGPPPVGWGGGVVFLCLAQHRGEGWEVSIKPNVPWGWGGKQMDSPTSPSVSGNKLCNAPQHLTWHLYTPLPVYARLWGHARVIPAPEYTGPHAETARSWGMKLQVVGKPEQIPAKPL